MDYATFSAWVQISWNAEITQTVAGDQASSTLLYDGSQRCAYTLGEGAGKANVAAGKSVTLTANTPVEIDLAGGWTDPNGNTIEFAKIKAIGIFNTSDELETPTICEIGVTASASNGWDDGPYSDTARPVKAGGGTCDMCDDAGGWAVTAGTADKITLDPGALAGSCKIFAIGEQPA